MLWYTFSDDPIKNDYRNFALATLIGGSAYILSRPDTEEKKVAQAPSVVVDTSTVTKTESETASTASTPSTTGTTTPKTVTTAPKTTSTLPKVSSFTQAEVATHDTQASCWTIVNGAVYDVTSWINKHPGGAGAIKEMCGVDASDDFNEQHGGDGGPERILASFKIGTLK